MDKFDIAARVRELNKASYEYYNSGQPIMSDAEFDQKLEELRQWEEETGVILSNSPTQNVGATVLDTIKEVTHKTPMLSLEKCHSVEEIMKFANNHNLVASVKLDGLTVRLTYKDGDLLLAESRGNGTVGSDITEHVKQFSNVPLHINKEHKVILSTRPNASTNIIYDDELFFKKKEDDRKRSEIISLCNVLVDGEYIDEQKDLTLAYRGSKNQRVIDAQKTLSQNKIILYCD